jgi:hypothetical protein
MKELKVAFYTVLFSVIALYLVHKFAPKYELAAAILLPGVPP